MQNIWTFLPVYVNLSRGNEEMKRPLETILKPNVQDILDNFSSLFNIRILVYSPKGEHLSVGLNKTDSSYCMLMRRRLYGESACRTLDQAKRDEAAALGNMICYQCHAGLMEAIKPVFYGVRLLGFIMIGQFRSCESVPQNVAADWDARCNSDELRSAYEELPLADMDRIDDIISLFSTLVDYIVMQHMVIAHGDSSLDDLLSYMEKHVNEGITLEDAARLINKSQSTVSHMFQRKLGRSFKQKQTEMKIQKAEEYMTCTPNASISEAAAQAGYDDPLYFSRIYKKYRGFPPSRFLQADSSH